MILLVIVLAAAGLLARDIWTHPWHVLTWGLLAFLILSARHVMLRGAAHLERAIGRQTTRRRRR